jgi:hypothetical protein
MRKSKTGFVLGLALVLAGPSLAVAQDRAKPRHRPPLRVDVTKAPVALGRYYRQCSDGPVVERRATGDTVVPRTVCWWAVR